MQPNEELLNQKFVKKFIADITDIDEENKEATVVVSSETIDRHDEVILASAFEKGQESYMKHPVLVSSHDYWDLFKQIGKAIKMWVSDGKVYTRFKWFAEQTPENKEADWAWFLVKEKMGSFSIGGFYKKFADVSEELEKRFPKARAIISEIELMEISQVVVPANREAVMNSVKSCNNDSIKKYWENLNKNVDEKETKKDDSNYNIEKVKEEIFEKLQKMEDNIVEYIKKEAKPDDERVVELEKAVDELSNQISKLLPTKSVEKDEEEKNYLELALKKLEENDKKLKGEI